MLSDTVKAYTVQCAKCLKWRFIPTKQKYEQIRETIAEQPFFCETAREWRPEITCDEKPDLVKDGSSRWAIDKPGIPRPPRGWERIIRVRAEGGTKFSDVYYVAPSGKRLRSMVKLKSFLKEQPEYSGLTESQFSFVTPSPLEENYTRKRRATSAPLEEMDGVLVPVSAAPISWVAPDQMTDSHSADEGTSSSDAEAEAEAEAEPAERLGQSVDDGPSADNGCEDHTSDT